jgi:hypothetical protein
MSGPEAPAANMSTQPPPLEYAAPARAGAAAGERRVEVRETDDQLTITIPSPPYGPLLIPRVLLLAGVTVLLVFSVWVASRQWMRNGIDYCSAIGLFVLCAIVASAAAGLVYAVRAGQMQSLLQVSTTGLLLDDPAHAMEHGRERRWRADEIGYVYVQRGGMMMSPGFNVTISVIRPGTGSMEHVCSLHARDPDLPRRLELLINRHLRGGSGGSGNPAVPVISA